MDLLGNNVIIDFFKDTLSGVVYWIYVFINLLFIFAIIGYVEEKKEKSKKGL